MREKEEVKAWRRDPKDKGLPIDINANLILKKPLVFCR